MIQEPKASPDEQQTTKYDGTQSNRKPDRIRSSLEKEHSLPRNLKLNQEQSIIEDIYQFTPPNNKTKDKDQDMTMTTVTVRQA